MRTAYDEGVKSIRVSRHFRITDRPSEGARMFLQAYESKPCICCGKKDHALLSKGKTRGRFRGREYTCPLAVHRDLYPAPYSILCIDYYPCPLKLAKESGYDYSRATREMRRLLTKGSGRLMTFSQWDSFWTEVRKGCEENSNASG